MFFLKIGRYRVNLTPDPSPDSLASSQERGDRVQRHKNCFTVITLQRGETE